MQTDLFQADRSKKKRITKAKQVGKPLALNQKKSDLSKRIANSDSNYTAADIEVLEGLEPVRRRPGMYIGGTDERALHHLVAEVLDNSMDEAVAGYANRIEVQLAIDQSVTISDNGRGIPVDPHPKFANKSALEVILTTLHSGGKFSGDAYETSGGLHGVGISVVNALSDRFEVEVARDQKVWRQTYSCGKALGPLEVLGTTRNRRGTTITFHPDSKIFGASKHFSPETLFRMVRSKAYLFKGVEIRWVCNPKLLKGDNVTPDVETLHFPGGLSDFLSTSLGERKTTTPLPFAGEAKLNGRLEKAEWAVTWPVDEHAFFNSYCNTVPTPLGGTHELGFKGALSKGLRAYGELVGMKQAAKISGEDVAGGACIMLSVFIDDPQFQGQTKERLATAEAQRHVENVVRDHFDHWLSGAPDAAQVLLEHIIERAEMRLKKREQKPTKRQSATRRLRLPGKLSDCANTSRDGTELFIVEGDSAGGSAKQARERKTQAVLPLRGKILNVASATADKMRANQELCDLIEAIGCGLGDNFIAQDLRYEKIIIMTDADVDGAHIASLLMTFFFKEIPGLIEGGYLYLALPPLYRLSQSGTVAYARDDVHKDKLLENHFKGRGKVEISRFKGLGEMPPAQLKETTMSPSLRTLARVTIPNTVSDHSIIDSKNTARLVDDLMGRNPEKRFKFIQENAEFVKEIDI
ncbi:MAG: DNA topoisomerase IV subunit B [Rhodospirillaceae bacterium TMED8]|nr:DNA topoisomerase IV subunit B [Magnetovibrio sp.]OUT51540.1 MAG: DNA topoisomerase IV subunit B [Rhodospirillaceae bacterium TMED8]